MAFTESSNPSQANSLVSFLDTASKTINGLMDKSSKGNKRKVNHKKYLQKRLQRKPAQPKAAKQTKSKSALLPSAALLPKGSEAPAAGVPPIVHHNSWPQLQGYSQPSVEPDIDFLLQQLSSTASDMPPQPVVSRPCSETSFYPIHSFVPPPPPPAVSLENQVLIAEQPYGSPYTPSNSSVEEFLDDSAYSSPSSSVHSSPATISLAHEWNTPTATTTVPGCVPTTTTECWDLPGMPSSCMATCSDWLSVTSSPIFSTACPPMDQRLPTVPQVWDQLTYSEHMHY
jgi:hypothetical protein